MQQILPELKDNTAVYVVSPQWFTKKGMIPLLFNKFFNSDHWIALLTIQDAASQYAAKRLHNSIQMSLQVLNENFARKVFRFDQSLNQLISHLVQREDAFCLVICNAYKRELR